MEIIKGNPLLKELYELELGGELVLSQAFSYTRVPGGWVMIKDNGINYGYTCFIPYDNEFQGNA